MLNPANYFSAIAATGISLLLAYTLHTCSVQVMEKQHKKDIAAVQTACTMHEINNQSITTGASNVFQSGLNQLEHDYAGLMQQRSCVSIIDPASATGRPDAANGEGKPRTDHAVNSDEFYRFSYQCEKDRLKVIGLQQFIQDERK